MPVEITLSDNERYILYRMSNPLNIEELLRAYEQERAYRDAHDYSLHSIIDMTDVHRIPTNWLTAKAGPGFTHPRSGSMLFVGVSPGLRIVVGTILKIVRYERMQFFETHPEAEAYMQVLLDEGATSA